MQRASSAARRRSEGHMNTEVSNNYSPLASSPSSNRYSSKSKSLFQRFALPLVLFSLIAALLYTDMPFTTRIRQAVFPSSSSKSLSMDQASHINDLGFRILQSLPEKDALISPYSIASALSMLAAGTTAKSPAESEFLKLLPASVAAPKSPESSVTLHVATSAWVSSSVRKDYIKQIQSQGAEVEEKPESVDVVNAWVSKATDRNIPSILNSLPEPLVALVINAVFFKAQWTKKFDPADTVDMPFQGAGNVRMMHMRNERFPYAYIEAGDGKAQIVEIPYGKEEYAAVAVLPDEGTTLDSLIKELGEKGASGWSEWMEQSFSSKIDVLGVPRFKVEYGAKSLKDTLKSMGLRTAFVIDASAPPFLRLTEDRETYIKDIIHKATLECTEEGTVATAATAAILMTRSMPRANPVVILNRPFLFAIRNRETGVLMFLGRVDKPINP